MKRLIITFSVFLTLSGITSTCFAQSFERQGTIFTAIKKGSAKLEVRKTPYTWVDSQGIVYPIYMGPTGSCFIYKVSLKTGKEYKSYLSPEVSKQICKELGVEYKPKKS